MTTILLALLAILAPRLEVHDQRAHQAVAALTVAIVAASPIEASDLYRLAHAESRWTPRARSSANACGLWQQQPKWRGTTCSALQTRPVHAALLAIRTTRAMRRLCGDGWRTCYQLGPNHEKSRRYRTDRRSW